MGNLGRDLRRLREIVRETLELYDSIAEGYRHWRSRPWHIVSLIKSFPGKTVLDLGSGTCVNGGEVAKQTHSYVVCFDISFEMLRQAREEYPQAEVVAGDVHYLPFRDGFFDWVVSIASLHHVPPEFAGRVIREVSRVLKDGGLTLLTVWSFRQLRFVPGLLRNLLTRVINPERRVREFYVRWRSRKKGVFRRYYYLYSLEELLDLLRNSGLKPLTSGYFSRRRRRVRADNVFVIASKVPLSSGT